MKTINKWIGTILTNEIPFRAYIYQVWVWGKGKEKELTSVLRLMLDDGVRKGKTRAHFDDYHSHFSIRSCR